MNNPGAGALLAAPRSGGASAAPTVRFTDVVNGLHRRMNGRQFLLRWKERRWPGFLTAMGRKEAGAMKRLLVSFWWQCGRSLLESPLNRIEPLAQAQPG